MYQRSSTFLLRWLRVPAEPHAPAGDPASLRVFRAGKNYFNLRLFGWALAQVIALAGIIFWTTVFIQVEAGVQAKRAAQASAPASPTSPPPSLSASLKSAAANSFDQPNGKGAKKRVRLGTWSEFKQFFVEIASFVPPWAFPILWAVKLTGILLYLVQIPLTYAVRRLDYEMRWYIVTDRSLRIRTGVWRVQEQTMSFANLQQVEITRNPIQGPLGLSSVRVQSAGGNSGAPGARKDSAADLHTAMFQSVENGSEIRDLILERLRRYRATGLGDPDDHHTPEPTPAAAVTAPALDPASATATLAAARELLGEARELRKALAR